MLLLVLRVVNMLLVACFVGICGVVFDGIGGIVGWKVGMVD